MPQEVTKPEYNTSYVQATTSNTAVKGRVVTDKATRPFVICFHHKLDSKFTFKTLQQDKLKKFQKFLDTVADRTFLDVDSQYLRPNDKRDKYDGEQMIHYEVNDGFRIHGIIENGEFCVIRIDPNHKFHK